MLAPWVVDEVKTAKLNDKRLNERLAEVLSQLAARPTASIPAACGGRAEMVAAYRFCENEKTSFEAVLQPHRDATRQRMAAQPVVILPQDTTEIDATRPGQQVAGAGPLDGDSRRGRCSTCCTPLRRTARRWEPSMPRRGSVKRNRSVLPCRVPSGPPFPSKRRRAIVGSSRSSRRVKKLSVAPRRSSFAWPTARPTSMKCWSKERGSQAIATGSCGPVRIVPCSAKTAKTAGKSTSANTSWNNPCCLDKTIQVRGRKAKVACETRGRRQPRQSREAEVVVRAARVTLRPPWRPDRKLPPVTVNVVLVSEVNPPPGDEPVEWLLLTSLPIDCVEQVRQIIQYYCVRWMIEIFFRVLKSGCRVEERLFEYMDRLLTCLAVYMIVAWRTLYVCRLGRSCPEIELRGGLRAGGMEIGLEGGASGGPARRAAPLGGLRADGGAARRLRQSETRRSARAANGLDWASTHA